MLTQTVTLASGHDLPVLGFGTWLIDPEDAAEVCRTALEVGYRHLDSAQAYGNEAGIGDGLRASGCERADVFVTSKVKAEIKDGDEAARSIRRSLETAGLDYFDLMLIHCPQPWAEYNKRDYRYETENRDVWRALEDAHEAGLIRSIGVSNFAVSDLRSLLETARVTPHVNQVRAHIGEVPTDILDFCAAHDMVVEAYSPLGHSDILDRPEIGEVAAHYDATPAQVCVRYVLQLGMVALPKTVTRTRMVENAAVDFVISDEDMRTLNALGGIDKWGEAAGWPRLV